VPCCLYGRYCYRINNFGGAAFPKVAGQPDLISKLRGVLADRLRMVASLALSTRRYVLPGEAEVGPVRVCHHTPADKMKLSFMPGDLHLATDERGEYVLTLTGIEVLRTFAKWPPYRVSRCYESKWRRSIQRGNSLQKKS